MHLSAALVKAMIGHMLLAFASGVIIETIYTLNVILISQRKAVLASALAVAWGGTFLVGVNESFRNMWAAGLWCLGLGFGTWLGVWLEGRFGGKR